MTRKSLLAKFAWGSSLAVTAQLLLLGSSNVAAVHAGVVTAGHPAFDSCGLTNSGTMGTWWTYSPYWGVGFYAGGATAHAAGCTIPSSTWSDAVRNQGWNLIPIWDDLQAPCSANTNRMSTDFNTDVTQGEQSAQSAVNAVVGNYGFLYSVIYLDMEAFPLSCQGNVQNFVNGWDYQLAVDGFSSGVYGSTCSTIVAVVNALQYHGFNVPSAVWPAGGGFWAGAYSSNANVWNNSCLNNGLWIFDQRLYQYTSGHIEQYGGAQILVDSDCENGPVESGTAEYDGPGGTDESQGPFEDSVCQS